MQTVTEILIDFSTSMKGKMPYTKQLLLEKVIPTMDYSSKVGVKTFMSDNNGPKIKELLALSIIDHDQLSTVIDRIGIPNGGTPITAAIRDSLNSLKEFPASDKRIILLTDGEENGGGDYEAEAIKAGEEGIHCEIHIIGIGLGDSELTKAQSISNNSKGTTSNIPYTSGAVFDKVAVETSLSNFTAALSRKSQSIYTPPTITSSDMSYHATPQMPTVPSNAPTTQHIVGQMESSSSSVLVPAIALPPSQANSIELSESGENPLETVQDEINVPATAETIKADGSDEDAKVNNLVNVDATQDVDALESDITNLEPAQIDMPFDGHQHPEGKESLPFSSFDAQVMSGVFNKVLERMEELSREFRDLKNELKKGNDGGDTQLEQLDTREKAALTLVQNCLSKRYGDRAEPCQEPEYDQMFKVLYEDNGPVEYYVFYKILIEGAFYLSKAEWRVFLNNTKNTQVYVVMPVGELPEYVLVDNLLDWMLRGKIVPYLKRERKVEADTVWLSFG